MADKRLIDANALLRRFQKRREDFASAWRTFKAIPDTAKIQYHEMLESAIIVEDADTVDAVEVVHGRWEERYIPNGEYVAWDGYFCSACGKQSAKSNYCPNCGAKMDGGADHV